MQIAQSAVVGLFLVCSIVQASPLDPNREWAQYKLKYGKTYANPVEDARRFISFLASMEQIRKHNERNSTYELGLNQLSDWSEEEFAQIGGMGLAESSQAPTNTSQQRPLSSGNSEPLEMDWRKVPNRVSSVKDQGHCNSGWAFAAAGTLEGQVIVRTNEKQLVSLSAQDLIDCTPYGASCAGGHVWQAFAGVTNKHGINSDKDYPYVAKDQECKFQENRAIIDALGYRDMIMGEDELTKLIAEFGPVAVELRTDGWKNYQSGIFDDPACSDKEPTKHAVLAVGYGIDPEHGPYWILKNSWSEKWGEAGYIRLRRGMRRCGIGGKVAAPNYPN